MRGISGEKGCSAARHSGCLRYPSGTEKRAKNKVKHFHGPLQLQFLFRAMTPRTSSVARVHPCRKAIAVAGTYAATIEVGEQDAPIRPTRTSGKATAVVGNYAVKIVVAGQADLALNQSHTCGWQLCR